jgi:hypothetical protein
MNWYELLFIHSCGKKGTILSVRGNAEGETMMVGVCLPCGKEFAIKDSYPHIISQCAVADAEKHRIQLPKGLPKATEGDGDFLKGLGIG